MEHYKNINRELIGQVQEMRITIAAYQKELNAVRSELLDTHRQHVELKNKLLAKLTVNYSNMLREIDPEGDMVNVVKENLADRESMPANRRLSSLIVQHFRKSTSLANSRRSVVSVSPSKRRTMGSTTCVPGQGREADESSATIDVGNESEDREQEQEQEEVECVDDFEAECANNQESQCEDDHESDEELDGEKSLSVPILDSILEASEEENDETIIVRKDCLGDSNVTINQTDSEDNADQDCVLRPMCRRTRIHPFRNITNRLPKLSNDLSPTKQHDSSFRATKDAGGNNLLSDAERTGESRTMLLLSEIRAEKKNSKSVTQNDVAPLQDENISISRSIINESIFATLAAAPSSTPKFKCEDDSNSTYRDNNSSTAINSSRPRRNCRPKSLVEPKLNRKLRNETDMRNKRSGKRK